MKVDCEPSLNEIQLKMGNLLEEISEALNSIPCPTKAYLLPFRRDGLLHIEHDPFSFEQ